MVHVVVQKYESYSMGYKWNNVMAIMVMNNFISVFKAIGTYMGMRLRCYTKDKHFYPKEFAYTIPLLTAVKVGLIYRFFSWRLPVMHETFALGTSSTKAGIITALAIGALGILLSCKALLKFSC